MAKAPHISRKELREDELAHAGHDLLEWYNKHSSRILTVLIVVLAIVVGYFGVTRYTAQRRAASVRELLAAQDVYLQATRTADADSRKELVDSVLSRSEEVAKAYGSLPAGREALYLKGLALRLGGRPDEALEALNAYQKQAKDRLDKSKAHTAVGFTHLDRAFEAEDGAEALAAARAAFEKGRELGVDAQGNLRSEGALAMMEIAKMDVRAGNYEEAAELLKQIAKTRPVADAYVEDELPEEAEADTRQAFQRFQGRQMMQMLIASASFQAEARASLEEIEPFIGEVDDFFNEAADQEDEEPANAEETEETEDDAAGS